MTPMFNRSKGPTKFQSHTSNVQPPRKSDRLRRFFVIFFQMVIVALSNVPSTAQPRRNLVNRRCVSFWVSIRHTRVDRNKRPLSKGSKNETSVGAKATTLERYEPCGSDHFW